MSDTVQTALIVSFAPTLIAIGSLLQTYRNGRKAKGISDKIDAVHIELNGRLTALLAETGRAERSAGMEDERAAQAVRDGVSK